MQRKPQHRDTALDLIRQERDRQVETYGWNDDLDMGFGEGFGTYIREVGLPWLSPYSDADSASVEASFRSDYEDYEAAHGNPTWMHLIREEVAELFKARNDHETFTEAVQVAALCVSLCERLLAEYGEVWE